MELIQILLRHGASPGDSLLHAISEEYVEAVETLLLHEESIHRPNEPYVSHIAMHSDTFLCHFFIFPWLTTHDEVMGENRSKRVNLHP